MWNRHRESEINDSHEIGSGTKLYYLWLKGYSTWGERDTIFLCWLLLHRQLSTQPTRGVRSAQIRLASRWSESQLSRSEAGTQLTAFSQISAHASGAWRHPHPLFQIPIWDFYFDIYEWHILSAHVWTPALMLHLTNPCTKRKVLSLTKPKGKIYKTKSLHHYITLLGCPRGVMVKAMNCGIVVREFVLQSRYYVHFRANTLGKGMNPLILRPAMGK